MSLIDYIPGDIIPGFYIYSLIREGNSDLLKIVLEEDKENIEFFLIKQGITKDGLSPLTYAYLVEMNNEQNRNDIIELLFKDFVNVPNDITRTKLDWKKIDIILPSPLIYALLTNSTFMTDFPDGKKTPTKVQVSMAKDLIRRGADVTVPDLVRTIKSADEGNKPLTMGIGNTALMVAAVYNNDIDMTRLIISKNPETLKQRNELGLNALQFAFRKSNIDSIFLLIDAGADVTEKYIDPVWDRESNSVERNGYTYLHVAIFKQFPLRVFTKLLYHGINVEERNSYGETPLMLASRLNNYNHNFKIVKWLLENGADPNSSITYAVRNHNLPMAKFLLRYSTKSVDEIMIGDNKLFNVYITIPRYNGNDREYKPSREILIDMAMLLLNYGAKVDEDYINANRNRIYTEIKEVVDILKDVPFYSTMSALKYNGITIDPDTEKQFAEHLTKPQPTSLPASYTNQKRMIDEISKTTPLTDANVAGKQGSDMSDITPGNLRGAMHSIFNASHYLTDKEYTTKMNKLEEASKNSKKQRLGGKKTKHRQQRKNKSKRRHKL